MNDDVNGEVGQPLFLRIFYNDLFILLFVIFFPRVPKLVCRHF